MHKQVISFSVAAAGLAVADKVSAVMVKIIRVGVVTCILIQIGGVLGIMKTHAVHVP